MPERIREILDKILEWWKKFNTKQRALLISVTAVVVLALVILGVVITRPNMVDLIACSDSAQAAEVKAILDSNSSIKYEIDSNMVVKVDASDLVTAEMLLGENSIPSSGFSLENVTSGGFSSTEADKQKLYQKYLEDKFADRLSQLDYIKAASVDITLPENDGTILSKEEEGTAAVSLDLKDTITDDQAYAIARYVATQLGNATTDGITIIDYKSNVIYSGADANSSTGYSSTQLSLEKKREENLKKQVKELLVNSGVFSNVEISCQLDINNEKKEVATRKWSYPEGMDKSLLDSSSIYESSSKGGMAATPGTDSNDGTSYYTQDNDYTESTITDNDYDWLNDEEVTKTTSEGGNINFDTSSVAVFATKYIVYNQEVLEDNGTLDDITWDEFKIQNGNTVKSTEVDEELVSVISNATGISTDKISFVVYETPNFIDKEASNIGITDIFQILLAVLIFALLGFVVFRSTRREKEAEPEPELSVESLLESTAEAQEALEDIGYSEKSETRILIEKFVEENPDAVALLLRNWLNEDWE